MPHDLITQPIYPINPGVELGKRFEAHINATGQPETFPTLSTSRPPDDGDLYVLAHPVDVDRGKRPMRDLAPCPICSPRSPIWLLKGSLIWCAETSAIYCVGPTCSTSGWAASRLTVAQNIFLREDREQQNAANLGRELRAVDARLAWIASVRPNVVRADEIQGRLAKTLPSLKLSMSRATKGGDAIRADVGGSLQPVGSIRGAPFLSSTWRLSEKLDAASSDLRSLKAECGSVDPQSWADRLAPAQCEEKLRAARKAADALSAVIVKIAAGAEFLSEETVSTLARWSASRSAPHSFKFQRTAAGFSLSVADKVWRARIGEIAVLPTLPSA
jgi:hypothetical protein